MSTLHGWFPIHFSTTLGAMQQRNSVARRRHHVARWKESKASGLKRLRINTHKPIQAFKFRHRNMGIKDEEEQVKVLSLWASPYGERVLIGLEEKGVQYEYQEDNFVSKRNLLLQMNQVYKESPVLIHNDNPVCESLIISQYIDEAWTRSRTELVQESGKTLSKRRDIGVPLHSQASDLILQQCIVTIEIGHRILQTEHTDDQLHRENQELPCTQRLETADWISGINEDCTPDIGECMLDIWCKQALPIWCKQALLY